MDAALGWVGQFAEFLGRLFPRLVIVPATDVGVAFVRGKHARALAPGLHILWPLWTTWEIVTAVRQTEKLDPQLLTTRDGQALYARVVVRYEIRDALKALAQTRDIDVSVDDEAAGAVGTFCATQTVAEILEDWEVSNKAFCRRVRSQLYPYGVYVLEAHFVDYSTSGSQTLNHAGSVRMET